MSARLTPRWRLAGSAILASLVGGGVFLGALKLATRAPLEAASSQSAEVAWTAMFGFAAAAAVIWLIIDRLVLAPSVLLAAETRFIAEARPDGEVNVSRFAWLAPLPDAVNTMARAHLSAKREVEQSVAAATKRVEEQKGRLEAILRDLSEGVLVCSLDHRILLYNQAALAVLLVPDHLGLGRSLFNIVTRAPVLHALERLTAGNGDGPAEPTAPLVCATVDARALLRGRMSLILDQALRPTGYVLTFSDVTREMAELGRRDTLLRGATEGLRAPLANLRAAAETLAEYPGIDTGQRRAFEDVIRRESSELSHRLEALDRGYRTLSTGHWPMADLHSVDLFNCVIRGLAERGGPAVTMVGLPLWLAGDSHSLVIALERLFADLAQSTGEHEFDIEALLGDRRVYVEIAWNGRPVPSATLDSWLAAPLEGALGAQTMRDILVRHGSEIWSQETRPSRAVLRLPLPAATRLPLAPPAETRLPARPEFYDFDLLRLAPAGGGAGARPLRSFTYVVFDTETTGLNPSQGDEIVSIAAVRVVNGRILTGETFSRLVNPGRPIPPDSTRFHGLTDESVAGAPPLGVVLPQFKSFVADSVLVAHNAAFDLKFLKVKESDTGVRFDNMALDTLLLSAFLHRDIDDHSLDAIARRLGIEIAGRHTALGDALATAAVFVKLIELLEARGIVTLDALAQASNMMLEIKARQAHF
jgi:DNA polymerase-3 subunit epsilon